MTAFERFEQSIPELMIELAPTRVPDYYDDMLQQTAATRQRPAWSFLERWFPMGVLAQSIPMRSFPWRQLAVLVLAALLIAAGLVAYIGAQQRVPPPFGIARNGQIVLSTVERDIAAVDPVTGAVRPLITGPTDDIAPLFAPDGRHFMFVRTVDDGTFYWMADADGSNAHQVVGPGVEWFEWSPDGDSIVVQQVVKQVKTTSVVDLASGTARPLVLDIDIQTPLWRPNHDQILFVSEVGGTRGAYLVDPDGSDFRALKTVQTMVNDPSLSPDGKSIAYATWETGVAGKQGRIHILDIDSGVDRELLFPGSAGSEELGPIFSPDGTKLLIERYGVDGYQLVVAPIDGGPEVPIGESHLEFSNGAASAWSPDGRTILTTYKDDMRTWLLATDGSRAERVTWTTTGWLTWQRLAP